MGRKLEGNAFPSLQTKPWHEPAPDLFRGYPFS